MAGRWSTAESASGVVQRHRLGVVDVVVEQIGRQAHLRLAEAQRQGRAILWEKEPLDLQALEQERQVRVRQKPYVYQPD